MNSPRNHCSLSSQYILNDPFTSKRHLRIYTVVYENDEPNEIDTLVYAEDLSQNGTYWNGSFIGKGNGGFLLTDEDVLRLSRQTYFVFTATSPIQTIYTFDHTQEMEMKVTLTETSFLQELIIIELPQRLYSHRPTTGHWCVRQGTHGS